MLGMALQLELSALLLYRRRAKVTGFDSPALEQYRTVLLRTRRFSSMLAVELDDRHGIAQLELNCFPNMAASFLNFQPYSVCRPRDPQLLKNDIATAGLKCDGATAEESALRKRCDVVTPRSNTSLGI